MYPRLLVIYVLLRAISADYFLFTAINYAAFAYNIAICLFFNGADNVNQTPLHKCFVLSFFYTGIDLSNNSEMSTANNKIITSFTKLKNVQRKICTRT